MSTDWRVVGPRWTKLLQLGSWSFQCSLSAGSNGCSDSPAYWIDQTIHITGLSWQTVDKLKAIFTRKSQSHEKEMNGFLLEVGLFQSNISNVYVQLLWGALPGTGSFVTGSHIIQIPPSLIFKYAFCKAVNSEYRIDIYI